MATAMFDELVGRRVALRYRIAPDASAGPSLTDAVGDLEADGSEGVIVHTRSGPVRVARGSVVAVRAVPPAPPRRASRAAVERLERLRSTAWPGQVRIGLGGWELRAAGGYTRRANSTLVLGDPGIPVEAALRTVREFAAAHHIDPLVQAPVGSPWSNRIREAGWDVPTDDPGECLVLVMPLDDVGRPGTTVPDLPATPSDGWWSVFDEPVPTGGSPALAVIAPGPVARPGEQSKAAADTRAELGFGGIVSDGGTPIGAIRAAVVGDHVYISRVQVRPEHRRRGLAGDLMRDALAWARSRGARHAMLDVTADNTAARALYARDGWIEHHRYHYLAPP